MFVRVFPQYTKLAMFAFLCCLNLKISKILVQLSTISNLFPLQVVQIYDNVANFVCYGKTQLKQFKWFSDNCNDLIQRAN